MTIPVQSTRQQIIVYAGQSLANTVISFTAIDYNNIAVYKDDVLLSSGYSVSGNTITFNPPIAGKAAISILSNEPVSRTYNFIEHSQWNSNVINPQLDRLELQVQQVKDSIGLVLKPSETKPITPDEIEKLVNEAEAAATKAEDEADRASTEADAAQAEAGKAAESAIEAAQSAAEAKEYRDQAEKITLGMFLQDGAGAVARTYVNKAKDIVAVTDFGAVGDGISDDSLALQNALNTGRSIHFTQNLNYLISKTLILSSNTVINGNNSSIIVNKSWADEAAMFAINKQTNITLENFIFNANGHWSATPFPNPYADGDSVGFTNNQAGIKITQSKNIKIRNCIFINMGIGIYIEESTVDGLDNIFNNLGYMAIYISASRLCSFRGNVIQDVLGGITPPGDTEIKYSMGYGILAISSDHITLTENEVINCKNYGIFAENVNQSIFITNNRILSCGLGIYLNQGDGMYSEISANLLRKNNGQGIEIFQARGVILISSNRLVDNGQQSAAEDVSLNSGIRVFGYYYTQQVIIKGNIFYSSAVLGAQTGQLYSIMAVAGGDFNSTTELITHNDFIFAGVSAGSYPNSLRSVPCSFAFADGKAVYAYDIGNNNIQYNNNSKEIQPGILNNATGFANFVGHTVDKPTSGSYKRGDYMLTANAAGNNYFGWICIADGSPGGWVEFGAVV